MKFLKGVVKKAEIEITVHPWRNIKQLAKVEIKEEKTEKLIDLLVKKNVLTVKEKELIED